MSKPAVLVTGGATRIGAQIARTFADAGWHVVIHFRGSDEAARTLAGGLASAEIIACDLADGDDALAMVERLAARLDDWRVLVNNAAVFPFDTAARLDPAIAHEAMEVNALTPTRMAQAFLALARSQAGRTVIQITDQKLANPNPDFFSYTMSKHALAATVPMLAQLQSEGGAAQPGDRVYALAPGAILASHDQREEETEVSHRLNPLRRRTGVDELARAALFLSCGALRSGSTLFVDSGQHLLLQKRDVIYLARAMVADA